MAGPAPGPHAGPVRPLSTVTDLSARRSARETAVLSAATAPVLHVTASFLDALNCRGEWAPEAEASESPRVRLRAV